MRLGGHTLEGAGELKYFGDAVYRIWTLVLHTSDSRFDSYHPHIKTSCGKILVNIRRLAVIILIL